MLKKQTNNFFYKRKKSEKNRFVSVNFMLNYKTQKF